MSESSLISISSSLGSSKESSISETCSDCMFEAQFVGEELVWSKINWDIMRCGENGELCPYPDNPPEFEWESAYTCCE